MYSQLLEGLKCESQIENNGRARTWGTLPGSQHYRGIRGACWSSGMGLGRNDKLQSLTRTCIKPTPSGQCIVGALLVLGRATGNSNTQDSPRPGLGGKPPPSPLQYILCLSTGATSKWLFVLGFPKWESRNSHSQDSRDFATLRARNFLCRPPIEMRSKTKLQPLSRSFQRYVTRCLHIRKSSGFLTFSGRKSNCQFDSRPFFWP